MFHEYPKWLGTDAEGKDIIVFSAEEEARHKPQQSTPEPVAESAPAIKKRGRPRKVAEDGNGSDTD